MSPLVLETEDDIDLVHTMEIEVDDTGRMWLHDMTADCRRSEVVQIHFPAEKAAAICAAIMAAAREATP